MKTVVEKFESNGIALVKALDIKSKNIQLRKKAITYTFELDRFGDLLIVQTCPHEDEIEEDVLTFLTKLAERYAGELGYILYIRTEELESFNELFDFALWKEKTGYMSIDECNFGYNETLFKLDCYFDLGDIIHQRHIDKFRQIVKKYVEFYTQFIQLSQQLIRFEIIEEYLHGFHFYYKGFNGSVYFRNHFHHPYIECVNEDSGKIMEYPLEETQTITNGIEAMFDSIEKRMKMNDLFVESTYFYDQFIESVIWGKSIDKIKIHTILKKHYSFVEIEEWCSKNLQKGTLTQVSKHEWVLPIKDMFVYVNRLTDHYDTIERTKEAIDKLIEKISFDLKNMLHSQL